MANFKNKMPLTIEAQQFHPEKNWVDCVIPWDNKSQPRDMSWGYIDVMGGKIHVKANDWIYLDGNNYCVLSNEIFNLIYEPAE
jgi:hypothetical protein